MTSRTREKVELPSGQSFRVLRWAENLRDVEVVLSPHHSVRIGGEGDHWHYHQASELTFFSSGEGTRFVGDHIAPFGPGDLVLLGENLPHYWHARGASNGLAVQWSLPVSHPLWGFPEAEVLTGYFERIRRGIRFRGATADLLSAQLQQLARSHALERLGLFLRLLARAATAPAGDWDYLSTSAFSLTADSRHQTAMRAAMQFLVARFRSEIRLEQVLKVTGMSKPTFCRQFKKHYGKTLNAFLQGIRLEAACRELAETENPVIDVAFASGFSQISFFNRLFRRVFKCSPLRYRLRVRRSRSRQRTQRRPA